MATIEKRGNSYRITVSVGYDMSGRQIREKTTFTPTKKTPRAIEKEVQAAAADFEKRVKNGQYLTGERISFEQFNEQYYVPQWLPSHLTPSQREKYQWYVKRYAYPSIRTLKIGSIKPLHIQTIVDSMNKAGLAPATTRHAHTAINSVFKYAYRMQIIDSNPCERAELPRKDADTALHYFTRDQALNFLDFLAEPFTSTTTSHDRTDDTGKGYHVDQYTASYYTGYQFRVLFNLAIYGGFRRGELIALKWKDVDFADSSISVRRAAAKSKGQQYVKEPKTKKSIRTVVMPSESMEMLREWKKQQQELCLHLGTQWKGQRGTDYDENWIFIQTDSGLEMYVDTPSQKFHKMLIRYNDMIAARIESGTATEDDKLPLIRFHDLRHTCATLLIAAGLDIETIAHRLGHSRVSITLDRYGHALPENDRKAAAILEKIFARA